jgi:hypothetical protein
MSAGKAKRPARSAAKVRKLADDLIAAISLSECAQRSLELQEIAAPEQVALDHARKLLWRVHDELEAASS